MTIHFGEGRAVATADLELMSLILEFRAFLAAVRDGRSGYAEQVLSKLKERLLAAKAFIEEFENARDADAGGAEMFSLLIAVENPKDWDSFRQNVDTRLKQIDCLGQGNVDVNDLKRWADDVLNAIQERNWTERLKSHIWWSL